MSRSDYHDFKCFVLPSWIHRAAIRNNLNILDLMDYSKVRKVLSLDDLAEWIHVNDSLKIDNCRLSENFIDFHFHSMTEADMAEYTRHAVHLSFSDDVKSSAKAKLDGSNPMNEHNYDFVYVDNILFVLVNEGFNKAMENNENKLDFIKNYLKKCYEFLSVAKVSSLPIYRLYLRQFSIQAIAA